jgi:nitroreductase
MDAYRAITTKRDRREYDPKAVPDEVVRRILQAGRMAGSSQNKQPLRFVAVRDKAVVEALAPAGVGTNPMRLAPLTVVLVSTGSAGGFDVGRAAQNMMIAAWAEGVISCPQGLQNQEMARKALGLPEGHMVAIGVAFGYPQSGSPKGRGQPRLPFDEIVHWDRW